jgi:hypothetical protein
MLKKETEVFYVSQIISAFKAVEEEHRLFAEGTVKLGRYGWTFPMVLTSDDLLLIVKRSTDEMSADAAFVEFYTANGGVALQELKELVLSQDELKNWRPLLEEAIFCLENGKYRSCVASLLPIIEGVLSKQVGWRKDRKAFFAAKLEAVSSELIEHSVWLSLQNFYNELFASSDFDDQANRPTRLNRHWILHGRDIPSGELSDCLRLLQAISCIFC